eukprot:15448480-Alexandrium_andersonii.AAC.1
MQLQGAAARSANQFLSPRTSQIEALAQPPQAMDAKTANRGGRAGVARARRVKAKTSRIADSGSDAECEWAGGSGRVSPAAARAAAGGPQVRADALARR